MNTHSRLAASSSSQTSIRPWYRETAMMIVIGVLASTLFVSAIIISLAVSSDDPLVISEQEYQTLKDEMRGTNAKEPDDDEKR